MQKELVRLISRLCYPTPVRSRHRSVRAARYCPSFIEQSSLSACIERFLGDRMPTGVTALGDLDPLQRESLALFSSRRLTIPSHPANARLVQVLREAGDAVIVRFRSPGNGRVLPPRLGCAAVKSSLLRPITSSRRTRDPPARPGSSAMMSWSGTSRFTPSQMTPTPIS